MDNPRFGLGQWFARTGVAPEQPIPNPPELIRRDANAGVVDRDEGVAVLAPDGDLDASAGGSVFDGVVDEIRRDLLEPGAISHHDDVVGR